MPDLQERTEPATPRKRQESRRRGQVARSVEVTTSLLLLMLLGFFRLFGDRILNKIANLTAAGLQQATRVDFTPDTVENWVSRGILWILLIMLPIFLIALVVALLSNFVQVGFVLSGYPLIPQFQKLDPIKGVARLFSLRSFVELLKNMVKIALVSLVAYFSIRAELITLASAMGFSPSQTGLKVAEATFAMSFRLALLFALLAILDYIYQRYEFERSIRMTKQEVRDEYKRVEGDPLIRQRIRQMQRDLRRRRMMQEVPKADVIITNPTHVAVAVRYDPGEMNAPMVVAKGMRLIAEKILEIAHEHRVPIVQNPELARALYKACEVGDSIPASLFQAVAEVLALVYTRGRRRRAGAAV